MKHALDADLLRLLHGELPPERAAALRERMQREPELAAAWRRLERAWEGLQLPPPAAVPIGFSGRVMAHARALHRPHRSRRSRLPLQSFAAEPAISWAAAPRWVRASCAAALLAGVLLGAGLGARGRGDERQRGAEGVPALTESYWELVETPNEPPAATPALPSPPRGEGRR